MKIANGMEFINDETAIGKWENIGWFGGTQSNSLEKLNKKSGEYEDLFFLPNGENYWIFEGWTKGFVLNQHRTTAASYTISEINGSEFLFIEWKMGNYIYGGFNPSYYVFIRT